MGSYARTCKEPKNPTREIYKKMTKKKPIETDDPSTIAPNKRQKLYVNNDIIYAKCDHNLYLHIHN